MTPDPRTEEIRERVEARTYTRGDVTYLLRRIEALEVVDPEWIKQQREQGWPDMHPEDYCHRCGARIPMWCTDRDTWLTATAAWATQTGREGICCVRCLADMHEAATGDAVVWWVTPYSKASAALAALDGQS